MSTRPLPWVLIPPPAAPDLLLLTVLFTTLSVQGVLKSGFSIVMAPPAAWEILPETFMFSRVKLALKLSSMAPPDTSAGLLPEPTLPLPSVKFGEKAKPSVIVNPSMVTVNFGVGLLGSKLRLGLISRRGPGRRR